MTKKTRFVRIQRNNVVVGLELLVATNIQSMVTLWILS